MAEDSLPSLVAGVLERRRTTKVLRDGPSETTMPAAVRAEHDEAVRRSVRVAGSAPFHFDRGVDGLAEPWRAHVLLGESTDRFATFMESDLGVTSKEPKLLHGCDALVIVTWLPQFDGEDFESALTAEQQRMRDEEHLAASAAMVQSLLVMLTSYDMHTYWSSGKHLRTHEVLGHLGVQPQERFLAGVFVEYPESMGDAMKDRRAGAHREKRGDGWVREVMV